MGTARTWPWETHTGSTNVFEDITNIPEQYPSCSCSNHGYEAPCFNCSSIYMSAQHEIHCLDGLLELARCKVCRTKPFSLQHHFSSVISLKTNKTNPGLPLNNLRDTWPISGCWAESCVRKLKLELVFYPSESDLPIKKAWAVGPVVTMSCFFAVSQFSHVCDGCN